MVADSDVGGVQATRQLHQHRFGLPVTGASRGVPTVSPLGVPECWGRCPERLPLSSLLWHGIGREEQCGHQTDEPDHCQ
jgi:hypothetical protein